VFHPRSSNPGTRAPDSHGLGLSVVVRLLAGVGGRLEVMSRPGMGTTFWIHLPAEPEERAGDDASDELLDRVVTIRRSGA